MIARLMSEESVPDNPHGGKTLIVDAGDARYYPRPSAAIEQAGENDLVYIHPGTYEDKIFIRERPVWLVGAGRDAVQIFCRRGGPLYLQRVPAGRIAGITFRYVGSDQHSAINVLDSACVITHCRATEGVLSGVVLYGSACRVAFTENDVCRNRESGIFVFAGAQPRVADNHCRENHHFGIAVRDPGSHPDLVRNHCEANMLSGILLFHHAGALVVDNICRDNQHWGILMTPDSASNPSHQQLSSVNQLDNNPRGSYAISEQPLADIGR